MTVQELVEEYKLTGSHFHYFAVCETKLWYYQHRLLDNTENEYIKLGSQIDSESYDRQNERKIGTSRVDFIKEKIVDGEVVLEINEVKKSSKMKEANELQLLHYLFLLSDDETTISGSLRFPKERKVEDVSWDEESKERYSEVVREIVNIISSDCPPPIHKSYCSGCSMEEFCFSSGDNK